MFFNQRSISKSSGQSGITLQSRRAIKFPCFLVLAALYSLSLTQNKALAQDPSFSQFYSNPIYLNPALAGSANAPRFTLNSRVQWPGIQATYNVQALGFDAQSAELNSGFGIQLLRESLGGATIVYNQLSIPYSYEFRFKRKMGIRLGLQAGFINRTVDWSKHSFGDQIDPRFGFIYDTRQTMSSGSEFRVDFGTGALFYTSKNYLGIAIHHLNAPGLSNYDPNSIWPYRKLTVHAGQSIPLNDNSDADNLIIDMAFQHQGPSNHVNFGVQWNHEALTLGGRIRSNDAVVLIVGVRTEKLQAAYSYDIAYAHLKSRTGGSHEIGIGYLLDTPKRKKRPTRLKCPSF